MKVFAIRFWVVVSGLLLACEGCKKKAIETDTLFRRLPGAQTGVMFTNNLEESDSLNYFTYAYIYMGGGVSIGDINNDGLLDVYFTGNMVSNRLYLNKGGLKFEDISEKAGILGDSRWYTGTTMADVNNDGYIDIYCSVGGKFGEKKNQLFINNKNNTFTERAQEFGLADSANSVQSTFFDYDLDGDLDVYIANYPPTPFNAPNLHYILKQRNPRPLETDRLLENDEGLFKDVTESAGLKTFGLSLSATVGDLNQDGWPDIYISNDFSSPDYLFINNKDGTFRERLKQSTRNTSFYGMGVDIADFNNDQLLDILQVDMSAKLNRRAKANMASMDPELFWSTVNSGFHYQYMQNSLQMNNGNLLDTLPDFSNIARLTGLASTDWSWGPLFADLDNDGLKDVFISNGTRREINNRDYFIAWENQGRPLDSLLERTRKIPSEKIDNFVFQNQGDLTFKQVNEDWGITFKGFSNGCAYADLDNDGDLEIITNNIDDPAAIFENTSSNQNSFLTLTYKGPKKNTHGIGTKATLYLGKKVQFHELTLTRGFQSSVSPVAHFGLGRAVSVDSLRVDWPGGKTELLTNIKPNEHITVSYQNAAHPQLSKGYKEKAKKDFVSVTDSSIFPIHKHNENYYNDFFAEILLPHQTSRLGPNISVADLNSDDKDDYIVGGAKGSPTTIYFQREKGFTRYISTAFIYDKEHEDIGLHIFDADSDGDNDIYTVSGGNEYRLGSPQLQDRLYVNDGQGNFNRAKGALPEILSSGSCVKGHDFDKDGDLDLFVGGRLVPGTYPQPANSYILENQSRKGQPKFVNITSEILPVLEGIGMVTDAIWIDIDNDSWTDLIVVGEWMNIKLFKNDEGKLRDMTDEMGLDDNVGWWFSVASGDFDNDGDQDFIAGNLGLNFKYKATEEETFDIYFDDFDKDSTKDIVLSYYNEGKKYPVRGRECTSQQMPITKLKFKDYESFSTATLEDIYTKQSLETALHFQIKSFASAYFENVNGKFKKQDLPIYAQLSSINKILIEDFNNDGNLDVLAVGNLYNSEVETPRNDASIGVLLIGNGKGKFEIIRAKESGFYAYGDIKDMARIKFGNIDYIVLAKNNDYLQFIKLD